MHSRSIRLETTQSVQQYRRTFQSKPPPIDTVNLRTVTIKQLSQASAQVKYKGRFVLNNELLYTVKLCGKIVYIDQEENHTNFVVYDGTGGLRGRIWSTGKSHHTDLSGACLMDYYMVVANLVIEEGCLLLQTIKAIKVQDHNQLTVHMLEAIHQHCILETMTTRETQRWENAVAEAEENIKKHLAPELDKEAIIELLATSTVRDSEHGATTQFIINNLHMDSTSGRAALKRLLDEGSVYNTKDYDHYKLADNN